MNSTWFNALNQGINNFIADIEAFLDYFPGLSFFIKTLVVIFTMAVGAKVAIFVGGKIFSFVTKAGG